MILAVGDTPKHAVGYLDVFDSLIWTNRSNALGDCEIVVPSTKENIKLFKPDRFLWRNDDSMICRIVKTEIETDDETGDMLIVSGIDFAEIFDRIVVTKNRQYNTNLLSYVSFLYQIAVQRLNKHDEIIDTGLWIQDVIDTQSIQISDNPFGKTIHQCISDLCEQNGLMFTYTKERGVKIKRNNPNQMIMYDSDGSIDSTRYEYDKSKLINRVIVKGYDLAVIVGEQTPDETTYEKYIDASTIQKATTYGAYRIDYSDNVFSAKITIERSPDISGTEYISDVHCTGYFSLGDTLNASTENISLKATLYSTGLYKSAYSGLVSGLKNFTGNELDCIISSGNIRVSYGGHDYLNVPISDIFHDGVQVYYTDDLYRQILENLGREELKPVVINFDCSITDQVYEYRKDYNLGDIVTVKTDYGVTAVVTVSEVIESWDYNGKKTIVQLKE